MNYDHPKTKFYNQKKNQKFESEEHSGTFFTSEPNPLDSGAVYYGPMT